MEHRKLIQHGLSSLTMALPSNWIKNYGLVKGDNVFIKSEGSKLIISTHQAKEIERISIDVTNLDRTSILLYVQSLYRFGYNEIEIIFQKPFTTHYRTGKKISISSVINLIVTRMIGAEIIEQSKDKILIKYITKESEEDFKIILRRVFRLLNETSANLIEGLKTNDEFLIESVEEGHDNINKFVSYSLRLLNKYGYPDVKKTSFYCHIIASIDKIVDILKYSARDIVYYKIEFNKESIRIFEEIHESIVLYYDLFYNFNLKTVDKLSQRRDSIKDLIKRDIKKISHEELLQITAMKQILEILLDLTDFRMGLEY